jgi:peroxiredoxin Q/BCP
MVYETDSWWINVKPVFWKEIKVLVGRHNLREIDDLKLITFYRLYLSVYVILLTAYLYS